MSGKLTIATFNVESLDDDERGVADFGARVEALRGKLLALGADVVCLQEVDAQRVDKRGPRLLRALERVLESTPYAAYHVASTLSDRGHPFDVHNLVTVSRFPILATEQLCNDLVEEPIVRLSTEDEAVGPRALKWTRPLLYTLIAAPGGEPLHVVNLHLRAPLAAAIQGHKLSAFVWDSTAAWSEGFFVSTVQRVGEALEARLLVDRIFDADARALVVLAGDFNAEPDEMPQRIVRASVDDTQNDALRYRALAGMESLLPPGGAHTVIHGGRRVLFDNLLVSARLASELESACALNDDLVDEVLAFESGADVAGSFHAPLVATLRWPPAPG